MTLKELPVHCLARGKSDLLVCGCVWWWQGGGGGLGGGKRHAVGDLIYFFVYYGKLLLRGPKIVQVREEKKSPECPILSRDQSYL